eukprot:CAMPEP_0118950778 /NCGR_PEP_ID=MMETSP1169-20130426/51985_1 /TAXON_ID=36882 /ORGANISM="Pyramimonas obovata, Strain CCMP722" /LENGTH=542 /DNA_ID=CAMNT_0006897691 /DNA_START=172 /DNA_END=1800 /DNA_ORIENTATION=+
MTYRAPLIPGTTRHAPFGEHSTAQSTRCFRMRQERINTTTSFCGATVSSSHKRDHHIELGSGSRMQCRLGHVAKAPLTSLGSRAVHGDHNTTHRRQTFGIRRRKGLRHSVCQSQNGDKSSPEPVSSFDSAVAAMGEGGFEALYAMVQRLPLKRFALWSVFGAAVYALKDFAGLTFATFVMTYFAHLAVTFMEKRFPTADRRMLTIGYYFLIVSLVTGFGLLTIPTMVREAADLVTRIQSENPYVLVGMKVRELLGEPLANQLTTFLALLTASNPDEVTLQSLASEPLGAVDLASSSQNMGQLIKMALAKYASSATAIITTILYSTARFSVQFIVSMIFSLIIMLDLPRIRLGVESLKESRVQILYNEIAPSVATLGGLVAKSLQAQSCIASVNTLLTLMGMLLLKIPGWGFLSLIVFFCSFIPVAGVFMSTVPIAFVALTEYGIASMLGVVLMVLLIHAVEAYILNPTIYSVHLKLHPLLVLVVLVLAEHSLGVVGLLTAVPVTVFVVEYVIKTPAQRSLPTPSVGYDPFSNPEAIEAVDPC